MELGVKILFNYLFTFFVCLALLPLVYKTLKKVKAKQTILEYVDFHSGKAGTPTMGGVAFIIGFVFSSIVLIDGFVLPIFVTIGVMVFNALVGFYDDSIKIRKLQNEGLKPWQKLVFQTVIFFLFALVLYKLEMTNLIIPFAKIQINIGAWVFPIAIIFGLFFTNCTNLADGLDGLECFIGIATSLALGVILLLISAMPEFGFIKNTGLLNNFGLISIMFSGALFSFIFYNSYPAKIFMGDTGSLAVGGLLVAISLSSGTLLYLLLFGLPYVLTGVSVLIQVTYYKLTKKRIFLMAPLHHHFEKKGYHESKIATTYFIFTFIFSCLVILLELVI